jgi:O-acetyl-ADP-ribose deacetylase (regulator of RNase III)
MGSRIHIEMGDITLMKTDAIVNAANSTLLGGGGVDGAIHRAAGPGLLEECRLIGGCPTGEARITKGYNLPAKFVIHTVGPVWYGGSQGEAHKLASSYRNSLEIAIKHNVKTIAFPAISTGVYGYPIPEACRIALKEIADFTNQHKVIEDIYLVCFGSDVYNSYLDIAREMGLIE